MKHAPTGYDDTIKNAPINICHTNQDMAYIVTYKDIQNKKYERFTKATKKRAELSLLLSGGQGKYGSGRSGGRGGDRGQG